MTTRKIHADEVDIDAALVRRLLAEQFPKWADLPISAVQSTGTVNAIYRLDDHLCVRLPRVQQWAQDLEKEWHWLPKLAPRLSLRVPEPVGKSQPRARTLSLGRSTSGSTASRIRIISLPMNTGRPEILRSL